MTKATDIIESGETKEPVTGHSLPHAPDAPRIPKPKRNDTHASKGQQFKPKENDGKHRQQHHKRPAPPLPATDTQLSNLLNKFAK